MLTQFSVKNFKSIKDTICLDLQAASIHEHDDTLIVEGEDRFLPVSVIYGPNGGGKSNILEALQALIFKIRLPNGYRESADASAYKIPMVPYAFSPESQEEPTEYELFFKTRLAEYRYSASFIKEKITYESCEYLNEKTNRTIEIFERNADGITMAQAFKQLKVPEDLADTMPLISYLATFYSNNEYINDIWMWFNYHITCLSNVVDCTSFFADDKEWHEDIKQKTLSVLKEMDIDIVDFSVKKDFRGRDEIRTIHDVDGYKAELSIRDESTGTGKLFNMIPYITMNLMMGGTLVIDEIDAELHPQLLGYIIKLFTDKNKNKRGAQLIFTSHDLATMTNELFRRDEIWFAAKGCEQNTGLYSLIEFKTKGGCVRADASFSKQYLEGKYGADPYLRKIISWEDFCERP